MKKLYVSQILLFCLFFTLVIIPSLARAATVKLAWEPNTEEDLAGYKIYYGYASRDYHTSIDVGNTTTYQIVGLEDDQTYYFAVTAYNTSGLESDYSEEVSYTTSPLPEPDISVSPPDHNFGDVDIGSTAVQVFTVTNTGSADLEIYAIDITGNDSFAFSIQNDNCSSNVLTAGDSCTVEVAFSPASQGTKTSTLEVFSNDPDEGQDIALSGTGVIPENDVVIYNPSMEDGDTYPDYWQTYGNNLNRKTGWIEGVAHSGNHSIKIENTTGTYAGWVGRTVYFSKPYPKSLILGGWARAEDVAPGGIFAIDFYIQFKDGSHIWYYNDLRFSPGTHDWENVESVVSFSKGIKKIRPYCLLYYTTGTAWFDDVYAIVQ